MVVLWTAAEFSYILVVVILMYILNVNEIISILGGHLSSKYFATLTNWGRTLSAYY